MRKIILLVSMLSLATGLVAQQPSQSPFVKKRGLMLNYLYNDFETARRINTGSFSSVIRNKEISRLIEMSPGFGVTYIETLSHHVDFFSSLGVSAVEYPFKNRAASRGESFLFELDANINLRLLKDEYIVNPYLTAGVGGSYYNVHFGAYVPIGGGFQFKFGGDEVVRLQAQYRYGITETTTDHFNLTLGIGSFWTPDAPQLKPVPAAPVAEKDTDNDGFVDSKDQCPEVAGVAQYNGCPVPDSDNDGIKDDKDKCPTVAGLAKYDGCPIPDTDGDRINDEEDKCPNVAGVGRLQGCPEKDTDGDGVADDLDRCPNEAGPVSNNGCPERKAPTQEEVVKVQEAAKFVYFETGSAKLKATSTPALTQVVNIMKNNTDATITIEGHTDNVGSAQLNQKLSQDRAASVKKFLVGKGIAESRITTAGYGFDKPVAPNTTAAGRAKNRRVVMTLE